MTLNLLDFKKEFKKYCNDDKTISLIYRMIQSDPGELKENLKSIESILNSFTTNQNVLLADYYSRSINYNKENPVNGLFQYAREHYHNIIYLETLLKQEKILVKEVNNLKNEIKTL